MLISALFTFASAVSALTVAKRATDGSDPRGTVSSDTIADCTYWVNVQQGDSCQSITAGYGISAQTLYQYNPSIQGDCSGLKNGYSYCIEVNYGLGPPASTTSFITSTSNPTSSSVPITTSSGPSPTQTGISKQCSAYYRVQSGDGCQNIVDKYGTFSLSDFYSWNPAVGNDCTHLNVGYYVCVGVPGTPTARPTTSSALPTSKGPSPTQSGIVSSCQVFYKAASGDSCSAISEQFGTFSVDQFVSWNPAVQQDCSKLFAGYYYCVAIPSTPTTNPTTTISAKSTVTGPSPTQSGIVKSCSKFYKAVSGDNCSDISDKFGTFSTSQFISWNPAVQQDCSKLFVGYYYCIAVPGTLTHATTTTLISPTPTVPSPTQSGIVDGCTKYYSAVSGDSCAAISDRFGTFSTAQFIGWNPAVQGDCSKLFVGYYYCVAIPGTPTQRTTSPASPAPTQNGPQPQQAGITKSCNRWYKVNNGDNCYNIEQGYGITADQFNSWNPSVKPDCSKLFAGYYVCVGIR